MKKLTLLQIHHIPIIGHFWLLIILRPKEDIVKRSLKSWWYWYIGSTCRQYHSLKWLHKIFFEVKDKPGSSPLKLKLDCIQCELKKDF